MIVQNWMNRGVRALVSVVRLALVLAVLWHGAWLVFRDDLLDELRAADRLFVAGHYYDARAAYSALAARAPRFAPVFVRLGMVQAVRDEQLAANRTLAYAVGLGLSGRDHDLARLYQGRVALAAGSRREAAQLWSTVAQGSPLFPLRRVLEAESFLSSGDYAGAEAHYRAALLPALPLEWREVVHVRLATLRASSDPAGAVDELRRSQLVVEAQQQALPSADPFTAPLLPVSNPDAHQLAEALQTDPTVRPQLLGQLYLEAGMYALAEAQFGLIASNSPSALAAAAYAAYTRLRAGDRPTGLARLEALVEQHPDEPRARALLALAYLSSSDESAARAQLETVRDMAPRAPDTHLAWGQWYAAQHDYGAAAAEYRRALADAPLDERGVYVLALARFHLDTAFGVCEAGHPAAEEAAQLLSQDARAWTALAAARLQCGDPGGARSAAASALSRQPGSAEATYYLGRALAALGDRAGARAALVSAADLAPASPWRARAEVQLVTLGL